MKNQITVDSRLFNELMVVLRKYTNTLQSGGQRDRMIALHERGRMARIGILLPNVGKPEAIDPFEIRVRAWDDVNKEMVYPKIDGLQSLFSHTILGRYENALLSTGMKDSNGVEIWEGDIVSFTYWWFDGSERGSQLSGSIRYNPNLLSFELVGIKNREWLTHVGGESNETPDATAFAFFQFEESDFEVIGNVFQNSELLEDK